MSPGGLKEGLRVAMACAFFGALATLPITAPPLVLGTDWERRASAGCQAEWAARQAQIQNQIRTNVSGVIMKIDSLKFSIESTTDAVEILQIRIDTSGASDLVLENFIKDLRMGKTVRITKGTDFGGGQLSVELEDIEVVD